MPGRSVLVIASEIPTAVRATLAEWDAQLSGCTARTQPALTDALDAARFDEVVVVDPDEVSLFAVERSLRNPATPVTLWCETDASWTTLDERPFTEDAVTPAAVSSSRCSTLLRWAAEARARWVFRSTAQRAACEKVLGHKLVRAVVVPAPKPIVAPRSRVVVFAGRVSLQRRHGFDLLLRAGHELKDVELAVLKPLIDDASLLEGRRLQQLEAMPPGAIALVTARDGSGLSQAEAALAAGATPVIAAQLVAASVWPAFTVEADPPALAARVRSLLEGGSPRVPAAKKAPTLASWAPKPARAARRKRPAPLLTIGVPAYNAAAHLERCVHSLVHDDVEVLVINDGSTDDTQAIAERLAGPGVRLINQPNAGHGGAINAALREARGTWFRIVDADDFVESRALALLLAQLRTESCDLVLTNYAEVRPDALLPEPVRILGRLPHGLATRFDSVLDPLLGLTSWGPLLSTSTFRTEQLRRGAFTVTERSAYVDLEYATFGLEFVETVRHLDLDLYRYSLGASTQTVSAESYRKRYREHEAVLLRLAHFARRRPGLSDTKRRYIFERVVAPVAQAHLRVLTELLEDAAEEKAFRERMSAFPEVPLPDAAGLGARATQALKKALPSALTEELARARRDGSRVARDLGRQLLPSAVRRFFER